MAAVPGLGRRRRLSHRRCEGGGAGGRRGSTRRHRSDSDSAGTEEFRAGRDGTAPAAGRSCRSSEHEGGGQLRQRLGQGIDLVGQAADLRRLELGVEAESVTDALLVEECLQRVELGVEAVGECAIP